MRGLPGGFRPHDYVRSKVVDERVNGYLEANMIQVTSQAAAYITQHGGIAGLLKSTGRPGADQASRPMGTVSMPRG